MSHLFHLTLWRGLGLLLADGAFYSFTNPDGVTPIILMLGFLLLVANLYYFLGRLLVVSGWYGLKFGKHYRRLVLLGTMVIGGLLAMQSMGELSLRDVLVAGPLALVLYLYLGYGRQKQPVGQ